MLRDVLIALRWQGKHKLFTASVLAILALGIGANTAVFTIVDTLLLRPLPYQDVDRLVRVQDTGKRRTAPFLDAAVYRALETRKGLFDAMAAYVRDFITLTGNVEPDQIIATRTSPDLFAMLGTRARLGRGLLPSDGDALTAAVLSDRLWRRRFNADPNVIGRAIALSGQAFTVVGVMPPDFAFPDSFTEVWVPLRVTDATSRLQVIARLAPGVSLTAAASSVGAASQQIDSENISPKPGLRLAAIPWREEVGFGYKRSLVFSLAAVGLVLLIACADVASLLLSRAVERQREIAIRASLGAGFGRVARQLLAESLVMAVLGSAAGIAVAYGALGVLVKYLAALPIALPRLQAVAIDGRVLLFNTALCVALAFLFSLAPLLFLGRTDLHSPLRGARASGVPGGSRRIFALLTACEAGFAFLLLAASGLMVRSLIRLEQADKGFQPDHVLTMRVPLGTLTQPRPEGKYASRPQQIAFYRELVERLQRVPGVRAVGVVNNPPLSSVNSTTALIGPEGQEMLNSTRTVSPGYFAAMAIPLLEGRGFTEADDQRAPGVAIINEYLARQLFPGQNPLGQRLRQPDNKNPVTVVGVVKNAWQLNYDQPIKGEVYIPYQQYMFATFMSTVVARTSGDPLALASALRKEIRAVDPNEPVIKIETLEDVVADAIWRPRFSAWLFTVLGMLAMLLTAAGVYSVVAYTAGLRAREVGIRVALGASPRGIVRLIVRDAMVPLGVGLAGGLAAGLMLARLLASVLYEVAPNDPVSFAAAAAVVLAIGAAASAWPAWRAATADAVQALRME